VNWGFCRPETPKKPSDFPFPRVFEATVPEKIRITRKVRQKAANDLRAVFNAIARNRPGSDWNIPVVEPGRKL
jgi:hypothetical protein